jgi:hypothetical protein
MTISMGMKQIIRKATHVPNVGKANNAINPSETAITNSEETIPSAGCFTSASLYGHRQ